MARIKRNRKTQQTKFKVRCHRLLYTLVLKDSEKADKLKQSLPPSRCFLFVWLGMVKGEGLGWRRLRRLRGNGIADEVLDVGLQINDVPKKNRKGKRVA